MHSIKWHRGIWNESSYRDQHWWFSLNHLVSSVLSMEIPGMVVCMKPFICVSYHCWVIPHFCTFISKYTVPWILEKCWDFIKKIKGVGDWNILEFLNLSINSRKVLELCWLGDSFHWYTSYYMYLSQWLNCKKYNDAGKADAGLYHFCIIRQKLFKLTFTVW